MVQMESGYKFKQFTRMPAKTKIILRWFFRLILVFTGHTCNFVEIAVLRFLCYSLVQINLSLNGIVHISSLVLSHSGL